MATFRFNSDGTLTITTAAGTKHTFATVSHAVAWCRKFDIDAYPA